MGKPSLLYFSVHYVDYFPTFFPFSWSTSRLEKEITFPADYYLDRTSILIFLDHSIIWITLKKCSKERPSHLSNGSIGERIRLPIVVLHNDVELVHLSSETSKQCFRCYPTSDWMNLKHRTTTDDFIT